MSRRDRVTALPCALCRQWLRNEADRGSIELRGVCDACYRDCLGKGMLPVFDTHELGSGPKAGVYPKGHVPEPPKNRKRWGTSPALLDAFGQDAETRAAVDTAIRLAKHSPGTLHPALRLMAMAGYIVELPLNPDGIPMHLAVPIDIRQPPQANLEAAAFDSAHLASELSRTTIETGSDDGVPTFTERVRTVFDVPVAGRTRKAMRFEEADDDVGFTTVPRSMTKEQAVAETMAMVKEGLSGVDFDPKPGKGLMVDERTLGGHRQVEMELDDLVVTEHDSPELVPWLREEQNAALDAAFAATETGSTGVGDWLDPANPEDRDSDE